MSSIPQGMNSNTGASSNNTVGGPSTTPAEVYQPTVRVMRLYKPGLHLTSVFPNLPSHLTSNDEEFLSQITRGTDLNLSPYLLLPDSFGEIYCGEKFSAYIAVVNGYPRVSFYQVSLAIRLQTASTVYDLYDIRIAPNTPIAVHQTKVLNCNETSDIIVQQYLNELGTHTLRVTVQYLTSPTSEPKTLRKFYRFNVLQPLILMSTFMEINDKPMVQCQVTNSTKSPIYIEELNFIPLNENSKFIALKDPITTYTPSFSKNDENNPALIDYKNNSTIMKYCENDSLLLLQADESYAFAFMFTMFDGIIGKSIGHPEIVWCTTMGEFSVFKGEDTVMKSAPSSANNNQNVSNRPNMNNSINNFDYMSNKLRVQCISCPSTAMIGEEVIIILRINNQSNLNINTQLQCRNHLDIASNISNDVDNNNLSKSSFVNGLCVTGVTYVNLGVIESGGCVETTITVYALSSGLHELSSIYAVDITTGIEYANPSLCKILVSDTINDTEE
eukprot:gene12552-16832_t